MLIFRLVVLSDIAIVSLKRHTGNPMILDGGITT